MVIKRKSNTATIPSSIQPNKQQKKQDADEEQPPIELQVDEEDEEPISSLIEPFTKEQLTTILREAAEKHSDVASRVRNIADKDTVHRKIFVHGLGWDTTTDTLRDTFTKYGEIEDCKAVIDKLTGKSKGYGFVLFKTRVGAKKALKEPQKLISGRIAACQLSAVGPVSNVGGLGGGNGAPVTKLTQRKIYVSNVGPELEVGKVREYFSSFGEIEEGPLGIDKSTGKFKGFCLFVYKSVESVKKVLEVPQKLFEGHTLHCQRAIDGVKPGKGGSHHSGGYLGPNGSASGLMGQSVGGVAGFGAGGVSPVLGQALTALLATQGTGLGLNGLVGTMGGGAGMGQGGGYGAPGVGGLGGYPNQMGQGGPGRWQYGYNGTPYGGR